MVTRDEIVRYYLGSKLDYRLYNGSFSNLSMHYGIWDETTRTHREALANENRVVADIASIGPGDNVLDMGCGYGSTAVWLALNRGCKVTGITLSDDQVQDARALARRRGVNHLTQFLVGDFHRTSFLDETFTAVVAIESISHSNQKLSVLEEAWRLLAPQGRLVIADGYLAKAPQAFTIREQQIATACFEGVHIPPLPEKRDFAKWLGASGFRSVRWLDKTHSILRTALRVNRLGRFLLPISRILSAFNFRALKVSHMQAFVNQYEAFASGLGMYGVFYAVKPSVSPGPQSNAELATRPA